VEVLVVAATKAVVHPDTMVIGAGDTGAAERAVLATRWFWKHACLAANVGVEELEVVGIMGHVFSVRFAGDNVRRIGSGAVAEEEEDVWERDEYGKEYVVKGGEVLPAIIEKEGRSASEEDGEENL
jgi:hypothetical protein